MKNLGFIKIFLIFFLIPFFSSAASSTYNGSFDVQLEIIDQANEGAPTPPPPPPPPLSVSNISVGQITYNYAFISLNTNNSAICSLFWGKSIAYESGNVIMQSSNGLSHSLELKDLGSETIYHFKAECRESGGNSAQTSDWTLTTLKAPDNQPPPNIFGFSASGSDGAVTLNWQIPNDPDFSILKIYRADNFYPQNPGEGQLIYDADGVSGTYIDSGLENGKRYFYTAFSYDAANNASSGSIADASPFRAVEINEPIVIPPIIGGGEGLGGQEKNYLEDLLEGEGSVPITPQLREQFETLQNFDFSKIIFAQTGLEFAGEKVKLEGGRMLEMALEGSGISKLIKTIIVVFEREGKKFSFLLRPEKGERYMSNIVVPEDRAGTYKVSLLFFDINNNLLKKIAGEIEITKPTPMRAVLLQQGFMAKASGVANYVWNIWWIRFLLAILVVLSLVLLKEKTKRDSHDFWRVRRSTIE
ncbi:MAG TPA: hypothetical protein PKM84_01095 [Candidatus Pacearchaeota archaeon]|nr:hypothetical protein [Candidatus Pacearchaeota archaeon]